MPVATDSRQLKHSTVGYIVYTYNSVSVKPWASVPQVFLKLKRHSACIIEGDSVPGTII